MAPKKHNMLPKKIQADVSPAGNLNAFSSTGKIQTRFNKTNWSKYWQADDYSFDAVLNNLTDCSKVTVYKTLSCVRPFD